MSDKIHITDEQYRKTAYELFHVNGDCEIDVLADVSRSDEGGGAYVAAWVWVPDAYVKKK